MMISGSEQEILIPLLQYFANLYEEQLHAHYTGLQYGSEVPVSDDDEDNFMVKIGALHEAHDLHKQLTTGARA